MLGISNMLSRGVRRNFQRGGVKEFFHIKIHFFSSRIQAIKAFGMYWRTPKVRA